MSFVPDLFTGQVAVVTGGGTGIGRGIALAFARHGADLVVAGRQAEPLAETVAATRPWAGAASWCPRTSTTPSRSKTWCAPP